MKKSVSFSREETQSISQNFPELRAKGIEYIQELSGDIWTDYNAHDPGVTILEQLCYALTDLGYRTDFPIEDLLMPDKEPTEELFKNNNAFFSPATIFSAHPVTITDLRKIIIDEFDEIQNVWVTTSNNKGYEEKINGINKVTILPKLYFHEILKSNQDKKESFLNKVRIFLEKNRNLGEDFDTISLLEDQNLTIDFEIYLDEETDVDHTIANLFLAVFEFINSPIHHYSFEDMKEAGYPLEEIFSGPQLKRGFIKDQELKPQVKTIHPDELQKVFTKVTGVRRCIIHKLNDREEKEEIKVDKDKFFYTKINDNFESLYASMKVFIRNNRITSFNKARIHNIFHETWSKKHRAYTIGSFHYSHKTGSYRNPKEYHSIQNHFPLLYGIGRDGISKREPKERHAKALQLKAYLMFFEQHLANHLSQLGHVYEFFNIDFKKEKDATYYAQKLDSIPNVDLLEKNKDLSYIQSILEDSTVFYDRKNRIFDHLLARFGEHFYELPWQVALKSNLIKTNDEFNQILLQKKSELLMQLEKINYQSNKGASYVSENNIAEPSGLEQLLLIKTGIPKRENKTSLIPDFLGLRPRVHLHKEQPLKDKDIIDTYRSLRIDEIEKSYDGDLPSLKFWEIDFKTLFTETLKFENYRVSRTKGKHNKIDIIFKQEKDKWVSLLQCADEKEAIQNIHVIIAYFRKLNAASEGMYLVDHVLLRDFLEDSTYGFNFIDEDNKSLLRTIAKESWCSSEKDRNKNIKALYAVGLHKTNYNCTNTIFHLKNDENTILASHIPENSTPENSEKTLFSKANSMIRLFNSSKEELGKLRLQELEKIRLYGESEKHSTRKRQRRLVFQRKMTDGTIIDEDFFNLKVTIVLPDWPARFQDDRFKTYLKDLILERIPSHISNEILWLDRHQMKAFENSYQSWEQLKLASIISKKPSEKLKSTSYEVYTKILELRKTKHS